MIASDLFERPAAPKWRRRPSTGAQPRPCNLAAELTRGPPRQPIKVDEDSINWHPQPVRARPSEAAPFDAARIPTDVRPRRRRSTPNKPAQKMSDMPFHAPRRSPLSDKVARSSTGRIRPKQGSTYEYGTTYAPPIPHDSFRSLATTRTPESQSHRATRRDPHGPHPTQARNTTRSVSVSIGPTPRAENMCPTNLAMTRRPMSCTHTATASSSWSRQRPPAPTTSLFSSSRRASTRSARIAADRCRPEQSDARRGFA